MDKEILIHVRYVLIFSQVFGVTSVIKIGLIFMIDFLKAPDNPIVNLCSDYNGAHYK